MRAEDLRWQRHARCRAVGDPDLWSRPAGFAWAVHECLRHCPVLAECAAWAEDCGEWEGIVVGGQRWAARTGSNWQCRTIAQAEEPCAECAGSGGCVECGGPIVGRGPQAKTCSPGCKRARRRRHHREYEKRRVLTRRRCAVCRSGLPEGWPARRQVCGKESCAEDLRARQCRARNRQMTARRRSGEVLAA